MYRVNWQNIEGKTIILARNPSTAKTVQEVIRIATESAQHPVIKAAAQELAANHHPARAAFDYAYNAATYYPDAQDYQDIQYAYKTLQLKRGNCVDYTVLISALLQNLGIPHKLRVAAYEKKGEYEHIYPVLMDGTVLDCVVGQNQDGSQTFYARATAQYNTEEPYIDARDFVVPMPGQKGLGRIISFNTNPPVRYYRKYRIS